MVSTAFGLPRGHGACQKRFTLCRSYRLQGHSSIVDSMSLSGAMGALRTLVAGVRQCRDSVYEFFASEASLRRARSSA